MKLRTLIQNHAVIKFKFNSEYELTLYNIFIFANYVSQYFLCSTLQVLGEEQNNWIKNTSLKIYQVLLSNNIKV